MTLRRLSLCLATGIAVAACSSSPASDTPDGGASNPGASDASHPGPPGADSGKPKPPTPDGGTRADAGSGGAAPVVTLRNGGRHGSDLVFDVQGSDPAGQTTELHARLLDAANNPVAAFDTNWDGVADSAERILHFDASTLGQKTFQQTVTLSGLYGSFPTIASAEISLSDVNGVLSQSTTPTITLQRVDVQGSACDVALKADRCAEGLSCGGTPVVCQPGVAPSLTTVGYYGGVTEATEVFVGTDPDEDLQFLKVDFLDSYGSPIIVDLSGDGAGAPASSTVLDARSAIGQAFLFQNFAAPAFATLVPKILVTPYDTMGRGGPPVAATAVAQVVRSVGQSCDAYGISACATATACSPGLIGANNVCGAITTLQGAKCGAAPAAATGGRLAAWGQTIGASLWDPPSGCSLPTVVNRPESVVMLTLPKAAGILTISTAMPETDFDTVLYVLPACATSTSKALGCADDTKGQGYASTVTLTNVAAGTYAVVVDSGNPQGGHFGLSVTSK